MNQNRRMDDRTGVSARQRTAILAAAAVLAALLGLGGAATASAQTGSVTFSGTVTAPNGGSVAKVMITVVAECYSWSSDCEGQPVPDDGPARARPVEGPENPVLFFGETGVDSSGNWSLAVTGFDDLTLSRPTLLVWDRDAGLASQSISQSWESSSGIDIELEAGGRVTGRFSLSNQVEDLLPSGGYALVLPNQDMPGIPFPIEQFALSVDLGTGEFTSPAVAPGEWAIAYGNLGGLPSGYLGDNDAARVEIAAGRTAPAGTVELQRPGGLSGTVTDSAGTGIAGIKVSGEITSQNANTMLLSPFNRNANITFRATTSDDGTYAANTLVPGSVWRVRFEIPMDKGTAPRYYAPAAGSRHSCALSTDLTVDCWGYRWNGELQVPDGRFTDIAAGGGYTCGLNIDQTVACWGSDWHAKSQAPDGMFIDVAAGAGHTCAIKTDGTIACWGDSSFGQLDAPAGQFTDVAAGGGHTCAIKTDGTIACWGNSFVGQLDAPAGQFTDIAAGEGHTCAVSTGNTIACWGGNNRYGELDAPEPVELPGDLFTDVAAGARHSCAIRINNTVVCWGDNSGGQLDAPDGWYANGGLWSSGSRLRTVSAGESHSCAISADETVVCWGDNSYGQADPAYTVFREVAVASGKTTTGVDVHLGDEAQIAEPGGPEPGGPEPEASVQDIAVRDELIASQESLLNTYRCLFNVDTEAVPGGCLDGSPAQGPTQAGTFEGTPTQADVRVRDELIASQEALLNTYRCLFNVDTQIVPGGCSALNRPS